MTKLFNLFLTKKKLMIEKIG